MNANTSSDYRPREAIVLAAGPGSRLQPLTRERPKCLLEVGGMPLLKRLLFQLQHAGLDRAVLATGHLHEQIESAIDRWNLGIDIDTRRVDTYETENNAVSLAEAMEELNERRFLLCDGDILLRRLQPFEQILKIPEDNVLAMMRFDGLGAEQMKLRIDEDARVLNLGKDVIPDRADGESLGIQKIGPTAFPPLAERLDQLDAREREEMYYEDVFAELIDRGIDFHVCDLPPGGWTEIDTPAELEGAREMAARWGHDTVLA